MMWYNKTSGEHRWHDQPDANTLQLVSERLHLTDAGAERSDWPPRLHLHMASASCEHAVHRVSYPVWFGTSSSAGSSATAHYTGFDVVHSLPFLVPGTERNLAAILQEEQHASVREQFGSAAADRALVMLRAIDAQQTPPPSSEPGRWHSCASGGTLFAAQDYSEARDPNERGMYYWALGDASMLEWWKAPAGTHAFALPKNGTALFDRKLEWKETSVPARAKVWRGVLQGWSEADRHLLCDLARGFSTCGRAISLPEVHRAALRVKGYPWVVAASGTPTPAPPHLRRGGTALIRGLESTPELNGTLVRLGKLDESNGRWETFPWTPHASGAEGWHVKPCNLDMQSAHMSNFAVAPAESELEVLVVFAEPKRANELIQLLHAVWTPQTFTAWEEEVLNFGLFDVVYDHTFFSRDHPYLEDQIYSLWDELTSDEFNGSKPPLTIPETHAAMIALHSDKEKWYVMQLLKRGAWPDHLQLSAREVATVMQSTCYMEPTLRAVRRHYANVHGKYADIFNWPGGRPSRVELVERYVTTQEALKQLQLGRTSHTLPTLASASSDQPAPDDGEEELCLPPLRADGVASGVIMDHDMDEAKE